MPHLYDLCLLFLGKEISMSDFWDVQKTFLLYFLLDVTDRPQKYLSMRGSMGVNSEQGFGHIINSEQGFALKINSEQ